MARCRSRYTANAVDPDPIILLWLLRMLVPLGGHREFVRSHGFNNDTLAEVIGLARIFHACSQRRAQRGIAARI